MLPEVFVWSHKRYNAFVLRTSYLCPTRVEEWAFSGIKVSDVVLLQDKCAHLLLYSFMKVLVYINPPFFPYNDHLHLWKSGAFRIFNSNNSSKVILIGLITLLNAPKKTWLFFFFFFNWVRLIVVSNKWRIKHNKKLRRYLCPQSGKIQSQRCCRFWWTGTWWAVCTTMKQSGRGVMGADPGKRNQ